jgi:ribonuclease HII
LSGALYAFDAAWTARRSAPLCGADEAGRGAWAGPIFAAAAVLGAEEMSEISDSKQLSAARREAVFGEILAGAAALSVVSLPAWWIDRYGLGAANRRALEQAISELESVAGCALADGRLRLAGETTSLPRADGESAAVAAASVAAKVLRDRAMRALERSYPGYGFGRNAGYGTREHRAALRELGPCRVHRLTYAGVES